MTGALEGQGMLRSIVITAFTYFLVFYLLNIILQTIAKKIFTRRIVTTFHSRRHLPVQSKQLKH